MPAKEEDIVENGPDNYANSAVNGENGDLVESKS